MADFVRVLRGKYDAFAREPYTSIQIAVNKPLRLNELTVVDLSKSRLQGAGEDGAIVAACPRIQELDLSHSKVKDWKEVVKIVAQLHV